MYGYMFSLGYYFTTQICLHEWQKSVLACQSSIANRSSLREYCLFVSPHWQYIVVFICIHHI